MEAQPQQPPPPPQQQQQQPPSPPSSSSSSPSRTQPPTLSLNLINNEPLVVPSLSELCQLSIAEHLDMHSEAIRALPIDLMEKLITFMVDILHPRSITQTQTRPLKIRLIRQHRCATFRFLAHGTVGQAIQQIYERIELPEQRDKERPNSPTGESSSSHFHSVESFGLYQPACALRKAKWLKEDEALSLYDIDPSDVLDFKLKQTVLKLSFLGPWEKVVHPLHLSTPETTMKTFIVDESKTTAQIAQDIARKLGVKHPEEFSLKLQQGPDDIGHWLVPDLTLPDQGVDPFSNVLLLKRQFYFDREPIFLNADPDLLHFVFCQCLDAIVTATHPCSREESVLFAALQCQTCFGDYETNFDTKVRLKEFIAPEYLNSKGIWKDIVNSWIQLAGATEEKCKIGYIQLTKSLKTYGFTFFNVEKFSSPSSSGKLSQTKSLLLGISHDTLLILDRDTKETVNRYFFTQLRKWQVLYSFFSIFLADHKEEYLTYEAEAISQVLSTYLHHSLRNSPSVQKQFDKDYETVGRIYRSLSNGRRRSSDLDASGVDLSDFGTNVCKCPLYIEPKKIFMNPIFGNPASFPTRYEDIIKINKFGRMMNVLSQLSHKMVRKMSKRPSSLSPTSADTSVLREIEVKFSDKKVKTFVIDERKTVSEITREIGRRLGIKNIEEFSLQVPQLNPFPEADPVYSHAVQSGLWLNPYLSLLEQGVPTTSPLLFKKKFYFNEATDDCNTDPIYFNLLFYQSRDAIIQNTYTCTKEEAIQLAATLFQINFGDHNPTIHKPGFLKVQDLKFFLPANLPERWGLSFQQVEKSIYQEHRKLRGIKEVYAKFRYVQLCRSLKTYGATFFPVRQSNGAHYSFSTLSTHSSSFTPSHSRSRSSSTSPLTRSPPSLSEERPRSFSGSKLRGSPSSISSSLSPFLSLHHNLLHSTNNNNNNSNNNGIIAGMSRTSGAAGIGVVGLGSLEKDKEKEKEKDLKEREKTGIQSIPSGNLLLGFSRKCILILTAKHKRFCLEAPLSRLRRWAYNPQTHMFTLDFGDYEEGCFSFYTAQGESVSQYLSDYIDFIQAKIIGSQTFSETELQMVATPVN